MQREAKDLQEDTMEGDTTLLAAKKQYNEDEKEGYVVQKEMDDKANISKKPSESSLTVSVSSRVSLKKSLSLLHYIAMLISATGHSSIFISPSVVIEQTGSLGSALIAWLLGGLINMAAALCYVELGVTYPEALSHYTFLMMTFGDIAGFLVMWTQILMCAGPAWSVLALSTASYIIKPIFPDCSLEMVNVASKILAGWVMLTMVAVNCINIKYVKNVQTWLTSMKLLVLGIIIVAGFYNLSQRTTEDIQNPFEGTSPEVSKHALAVFYSGFFYGGWQAITYMTRETKNPQRDLPRACYITFFVIITLYLLTNIAFSTILTRSEIIGSNQAVASLFIERVHPDLVPVVSILIALATLGALTSMITSQPRLLLAGARHGHAPQVFGILNIRYLSPWPSLFLYTAASLIMLYSGGVTVMVTFLSLAVAIISPLVAVSLLYLRWKYPNEHRPYKTMVFVPWVVIVVHIAMLILGLYQDPSTVGLGIAILLCLVPIYWLCVSWKKKPKTLVNCIDSITISVQKLILAA